MQDLLRRAALDPATTAGAVFSFYEPGMKPTIQEIAEHSEGCP